MFAMVGIDDADQPTIIPNPVPIPPPVLNDTRPPGRLVFRMVTIAYVIWGALLSVWGTDVQATPIMGLLKIFKGSDNLAVVLFLSVTASMASFFTRSALTKTMCLMPQQALITMVALSSLSAVLVGKYADGTVKPWQHILADQALVILVAVFHTIALTRLIRRV